ncbi:MAG: restriction endonuclease subunit S [Saprospirales bacterium]|nr:restriction endonuclease subunit S [Saprospirales bacterium]
MIEASKFIERYDTTLNEEGLKISKLFPKGTIVMVIAGTYVGSAGVLKFDCAFTDSLVGITSFDTELLQEYLFYYIQFHEKKIDSLATEVAQRNLSIDGFPSSLFHFPKTQKFKKNCYKN